MTAEIQEKATKTTAPSIHERMASIMAEVGAIKKGGENSMYKFVRESDIANALRPLMVKHGVIMIPQIVTSDVQKLSNEKQESLTTLTVDMVWYACGTSESVVTRVIGQGANGRDKGASSALTSAIKYGYLKTFVIGTDDDPEQDINGDFNHNASPNHSNSTPSPRRQYAPNGALGDLPVAYDLPFKCDGFSTEEARASLKGAGFKFWGKKEGGDNCWHGSSLVFTPVGIEKYCIKGKEGGVETDEIPF